MNLIFDKAYDPIHGYCWLLLPWFGHCNNGNRTWLVLSTNKSIGLTGCKDFNNSKAYRRKQAAETRKLSKSVRRNRTLAAGL